MENAAPSTQKEKKAAETGSQLKPSKNQIPEQGQQELLGLPPKLRAK
jgi:hypothetical protein